MTLYGCTCGGRFTSYSTRTMGLHRLKYLRCDTCRGTTSVTVRVDASGKEIPTIVLEPSTAVIGLKTIDAITKT